MSVRYLVRGTRDGNWSKPLGRVTAVRKVRALIRDRGNNFIIHRKGGEASAPRDLAGTVERLKALLAKEPVGETYILRGRLDLDPVSVRVILDVKPGVTIDTSAPNLVNVLQAHIELLEDGPQATIRRPGCYSDQELGAVIRTFHYVGKGRNVSVSVKLIPQAMAALMQAMQNAPGIQVTQSYDNKFSGSYRSCTQQKVLRDDYEAGRGHLAAKSGESYHQTARSTDLLLPTSAERDAMDNEGFFDLLPQDPPHYTYGTRG